MTELLPCPFCGGEAEHYQPNEDIAVISCLVCNAESGYNDGEDSTTPDDAIMFWNARHPQQDVQGLIDIVKAIRDTATGDSVTISAIKEAAEQALKSYQEGRG